MIGVRNFILALEEKHNTYVKLSSPIEKGHSVRFKFIEGKQDLLGEVAAHEGVQIKGDSIEVAENRSWHHENEAAAAARTQKASERWQAARKDPEASFAIPNEASRYVSEEQILTLQGTNRAIALTMAADAFLRLERFLHALDRGRNYIRLYGQIKGGHVVDYELLNGKRADVKSVGQSFGLVVSDQSITTPGDLEPGANPVHGPKDGDAFNPAPPAEHSAENSGVCQPPRCPKDTDVIIVPAPGRRYTRSTEPNTMVLSVLQEPIKVHH